MVITRRQAVSLLDAHLNMEGNPSKPNKYGVKTRYSLVKNLRLLSSRQEDYEKVRVALIKELAPKATPNSIQKDTPEMSVFSDKWETFMNEEEDIPNLMKFTLGELQVETNEQPIAVLAKLGPVIIEDADPVAAK